MCKSPYCNHYFSNLDQCGGDAQSLLMTFFLAKHLWVQATKYPLLIVGEEEVILNIQ